MHEQKNPHFSVCSGLLITRDFSLCDALWVVVVVEIGLVDCETFGGLKSREKESGND